MWPWSYWVPNIGDKFDIDQPLWDQSTYIGRWKHFAFITDLRTIFVPEKGLREAKQFCDNYKTGKVPRDTPMADIICAKQLRDSAFHPETGELMPILGRFSFQLPISVILTTAMFTFYKSTAAVVLCQMAYQTHTAILNYSNRNAAADDDDKTTVKCAFLCTVIASCMMAIGCKRMLRCKGPLTNKLGPYCTVVVGHLINLPLMRHKEIAKGIPVYTKDTEKSLMKSRVAAVKGITECYITRIVMAMPSLLFIPLTTEHIKVYCFYQRRPWIKVPIEAFVCTICWIFMIPSGLAIFPQCNSMNPELMRLHPPEYEEFKTKVKTYVDKLYYNKGL